MTNAASKMAVSMSANSILSGLVASNAAHNSTLLGVKYASLDPDHIRMTAAIWASEHDTPHTAPNHGIYDYPLLRNDKCQVAFRTIRVKLQSASVWK